MVMQNPTGPTVYGGIPAVPMQSSFGLTEKSDAFDPKAFLDSNRIRLLNYRKSFFECTQHDHKLFNYDGKAIQPGPSYIRANTAISGTHSSMEVAHHMRRPLSPLRLVRTVVKRFTALLFGEGRFPAIKVPGDSKSQDFAQALAAAEKLHGAMKQARNIGGSVGTVGISWRFFNGKPRVQPHDGSQLHVHEWEDFDRRIPKHVTEIYQFEEPALDPRTGKVVMTNFWHRRDWTPEADVVFHPVRIDSKALIWVPDDEKTVEHGDDFCHFVWVRNCPPIDTSAIDGLNDTAENEESSDGIDALNSIVMRGALRNLDPTLVLSVEQKLLQMQGGSLKKGSDNALNVGQGGGANYLELAGASISAGISLIKQQRDFFLESSECVIPDPNQMSAAGMSRVALEMLYAPMLAQADVLREQYGAAIELLLEQQLRSYRNRQPRRTQTDEGEVEEFEVETDEETGEQIEVQHVLDLPQRVIEEPVFDETGNETGDVSITFEQRVLGASDDIELAWPPYFPLTDTDNQSRATALTMANGGKPLISARTATEQFVAGTTIDVRTELKRISDQDAAAAGAQEGMFPPTGGPVPPEGQAPEGEVGQPPPDASEGEQAPQQG